MKKGLLYFSVALTVFCLTSCGGQNQSNTEKESITTKPSENVAEQIGEYVGVFQDSKDNYWFSTLSKGVAKYDGNKLVYLTTNDGLADNRIVSIIEDKTGSLWFGTGAGISKYDGKSFTNYSEKDGLCSNMISNLFIDSKGIFWIGTWGGVCKFDGANFDNFPIPYADVTTIVNPDTKDWITAISEDKKGDIWFGRDGYGAIKFDGDSFEHITTKEGLNSNNVQSIVEDKDGNIWIGTRVAEKDNADPDKRFGEAGLNKYDGNKIIHFPEIKGLSKNDVYTIYKDNSKDLWFGTISNGVYKYANGEFINYKVPAPIMGVLKDKKGTIWFGCAGGLFKIDKNGETIQVTTNGPWD